MYRLLATGFLLIAFINSAFAWTHGNAGGGGIPVAAIGMNLNTVQSFGSELPFMNILKTGNGWSADVGNNDTGETPYLYSNLVDSNHYLTALTSTATASSVTTSSANLTCNVTCNFWVGGTLSGSCITGTPTIISGSGTSWVMSASESCTTASVTETLTATKLHFAVMVNITYPAGNYVFFCTQSGSGGTPTIVLSGDVSQTITCPTTRTIVTISSPSGGVDVQVTAEGTGGNYINSFAMIYSPDSTSGHVGVNETAYNAGETLNPTFVTLTKGWNRSIRFMDFNNTNTNQVVDWTARSQTGWAFWNEVVGALDRGVPVEIQFNICNEVGAAYCWFAVPCLTNDNYTKSMADLALTNLNSAVKVALEACNELFFQNFSTAVSTPIRALGQTLFATAGSSFSYALDYSTMRSVQNVITWKAEWGASASRVNGVQGGQLGNTDYSDYVLGFSPTQDAGLYGPLTGTITGGNLLTASGITGTSTINVFSRLSGAGITNDACYVASLGTGGGGNGTYHLGGTCPNVGPITMEAALWGTGPAAVFTGHTVGTALTCDTSCAGVAIGQTLTATSTAVLPHTTTITGGSGSSWTISHGANISSTTMQTNAASDIDHSHMAALATAPYFNSVMPEAITADGDGGIARFFTQTNSGSLLPVNASLPTITGGPTAYALTSGHGLSGTPANGTCVAGIFNQNNTGTATIAVDSVAAAPLYDYIGNPITAGNTLLGDTYTGGSLTQAICYTSATASGAVATPGWFTNFGTVGFSPNAGGDIAGAVANWALDLAKAQAFGLPLWGYEGGQQYSDAFNITIIRALYTAANRSAGMGTATASWLTQLKAENPNTPLNYYNDVGPIGGGSAFGALEYVTETCSTTPKCNAIQTFTTPYLLNRDLDPASNDNSPAWLDKAA
jgi:hypothetical protein